MAVGADLPGAAMLAEWRETGDRNVHLFLNAIWNVCVAGEPGFTLGLGTSLPVGELGVVFPGR